MTWRRSWNDSPYHIPSPGRQLWHRIRHGSPLYWWLQGATLSASTPRLLSPPCTASIPYLLPQVRPTAIGSIAAAIVRPTLLEHSSWRTN